MTYSEADIPVLQLSMPSEDPRVPVEVGRRLAPLRDDGILIMGSGFMTHSFDAIRRARMACSASRARSQSSTPGSPRRWRGRIWMRCWSRSEKPR